MRSDCCRLRSLNSLLEELRVREYLTTRPRGLIREDPVGFIPPSPMPFRYQVVDSFCVLGVKEPSALTVATNSLFVCLGFACSQKRSALWFSKRASVAGQLGGAVLCRRREGGKLSVSLVL